MCVCDVCGVGGGGGGGGAGQLMRIYSARPCIKQQQCILAGRRVDWRSLGGMSSCVIHLVQRCPL